MDNNQHVDVISGHPGGNTSGQVHYVRIRESLGHADSHDSGFADEQQTTTRNSPVSFDHTLGQSSDSGGHVLGTGMDVASSQSSEDSVMMPERASTTSVDMVDDRHDGSPSTDVGQNVMPKMDWDDSVISEAELMGLRSGIDRRTIISIQERVEEVRFGDMDAIVAEAVVEVSCGPSPVPKGLLFVGSHTPAVRVKIKWPMSYGHFLRAIENTDTPKLIIDVYRKEFEHQYIFIQEVKSAVDGDTFYTFMCFRIDLFGKSFYLTPDCTAECSTNEIKLVFTKATRSEVVQDCITRENSKYWYFHETFGFNVLRSVYAPECYMSIEKGRRVLLRNNHGKTPEDRNFNIQIYKVLDKSTPPLQTSAIRNVLGSCFGFK